MVCLHLVRGCLLGLLLFSVLCVLLILLVVFSILILFGILVVLSIFGILVVFGIFCRLFGILCLVHGEGVGTGNFAASSGDGNVVRTGISDVSGRNSNMMSIIGG